MSIPPLKTAWLERKRCLHICRIIQLPAMIALIHYLVMMSIVMAAFRVSIPIDSNEAIYVASCVVFILLYIYQVAFYPGRRCAALCMLVIQVYSSAFASWWLVLLYRKEYSKNRSRAVEIAWRVWGYTTAASFYVLLLRSLVIWWKGGEGREGVEGTDEEMDDLLSGQSAA